jgi:hypothetical protein
MDGEEDEGLGLFRQAERRRRGRRRYFMGVFVVVWTEVESGKLSDRAAWSP